MDQQQFRELALRELPAVYRMARHLTLDAHDADDLVQQTYLHALRAANSFELTSPGGMRPWLFKILHNLQRNRMKHRAREPMLLDDAENQVDSHPDGRAGTHADLANLDWDQVDERLKHAIHALPDRMRSAFLLVAVEGMKYRQVADILQLPVGTVMSTLHRARARLLTMLGDLAAEQRRTGREARSDEQSSGVECY